MPYRCRYSADEVNKMDFKNSFLTKAVGSTMAAAKRKPMGKSSKFATYAKAPGPMTKWAKRTGPGEKWAKKKGM